MGLVKDFKHLCSPALFYFTISIIGIFISSLENLNNVNKYSLGGFSCNVPSTFFIFVVQFIYIIFWTWILNLICKNKYTSFAWFLVLFPFILLLILFFLVYNITKK
jgi:type IV secretory pathway TrbL component